jgi:hypothetical protein
MGILDPAAPTPNENPLLQWAKLNRGANPCRGTFQCFRCAQKFLDWQSGRPSVGRRDLLAIENHHLCMIS